MHRPATTVELFPMSLVGEATWLGGCDQRELWQMEMLRLLAFLKSGRQFASTVERCCQSRLLATKRKSPAGS